MPRYSAVVWEARAYYLDVEATDLDEAKEFAEQDYAERSTRDEVVAVECYEIDETA